jgi:capsule polysaccharide export protein KpsE/RkpR
MMHELSQLQAKYATLKSPAKEKAKAEIDALQAKLEAARTQIKQAEKSLQPPSRHTTMLSASERRKTLTSFMKKEPFSTVLTSMPMRHPHGHTSWKREETVRMTLFR